ncbi:OmpA family protein [Arenimonas fontis]|uniref:OmpA family protein n=1 Tax=Arenimonas fontis TaxID=2608255 RepID=A0A5B2ZDY0_9GAMM|nr:OmpA family protein [Arenimonas fontis]KAA2285271.1 OmpA family protein [Arenimonas fontis]
MRTRMPILRHLATAAVIVGLAGCAGYVKRDEFDAAIAELRSADQQQQQRLDRLQAMMEERFGRYDARIAQLEGRLHVETTAHFAVDDATLRDADKPMLDDFARVIREHHPGVVVTVEGFADPSGPAAYNKRLGQRRAEAVRDYLVGQGLSAGQVRAVSYGEDRNRQIRVGATGEAGLANRRVALVIDFVEAVAAR